MRFIQGELAKFRFLDSMSSNLSQEMHLWRRLQVIQAKQLSTEVDFMVVLEMICLYPEPLAHKCCLIWRKDHCTSSCIMWVGPKRSYIYPERHKIRRMWCNLDSRDGSDIAQGKDCLGHLQQGLCPLKHSHSLRSCWFPDLILWPLEFWANSFPVFFKHSACGHLLQCVLGNWYFN